ncbi:nitroreductase [Pleionea sp. CnH1-48]|uniref:nitroreductase n=1 Tax=Pleionea sp. CnH1-48 TaxID=2954494 RepID=UPI00209760EC|nr:nitroreductase [Pleionea sp. CnH1-48]
MEFEDALNNRRSIRSFSDKPVEDELINEILSLAIESPSSSNTQPYKLAVATGQINKAIATELTEKYYTANQLMAKPLPLRALGAFARGVLPDGDFKPMVGKYPSIFQERRVATGKGLYEILGIERSDRAARDEQMAKNFSFFNAPVAIFFFIHPGMTYTALVDLGIFMQSLMLAATNKGLGTCAQAALGMWKSPIAKHFEIPKSYKLVCGLALGYPDDHKVNHYRPGKVSLDELLIRSKPV